MKKLLLLLIMSLSIFGQNNVENLYPHIPNNAVSIDTSFYKGGEIESIYYYMGEMYDEYYEEYEAFEYFKNGALRHWHTYSHGWYPYEKYYYQVPYGQLKTSIFNDGGVYSEWTNYYENGNIKSNFINSDFDSLWNFFHENGKLKSTGVLDGLQGDDYEGHSGMKTGIWKYYNKEGEKIKEIDYGKHVDVMGYCNRTEYYRSANYYHEEFDIESLTPNKDYELIELFSWVDNLGKNLLIAFKINAKRQHYDIMYEEYTDTIDYTKKLHIFHYLIDEQNNKKLIWDLKDYSDWGIEYIDTSISDWDSDGVAETSVIYFLEKRDWANDIFNTDIKLILHESDKKFAVRGNCNGELMSRCYCNYNMYGKNSFKKASDQFQINTEIILYDKLKSSFDCCYKCWDESTLQKINCDYPD